jgi:superfamily I DNA/RNA helicase
LKFNIPEFQSTSKSATYSNLHDARKASIEDGYFFYDDMYAFANYAMEMYPNYINNVRNRFPLIFIDEAQDNNKTQDDLLEKIFNDEHCIYQRFGDSDQAIYDFQNAEGADTFGTNTDRLSDINISDSKRFPTEHITLINKFKCSAINLTALSVEPKLSPQIIYYTDTCKQQVVRNFLNLIDSHFNYEDQPVVKIIGFIHKDGAQHNIGSYIENFKKYRKDKKVETLIELMHNLKCNLSNTNTAFYSVIGFILKYNKIEYQGKRLTLQRKSAIRAYLHEMDINNTFRKSLLSLLQKDIDISKWQAFYSVIISVFGITTLSDRITTFVAASEDSMSVEDDIEMNIKCDNDNCLYTPQKHIRIEVDTIHGVKGETHDATLVLETYYKQQKDLSCVVQNKKSTNMEKFKKQLYVATSRAKSLLCIAVEDTQSNRQGLSDISLPEIK